MFALARGAQAASLCERKSYLVLRVEFGAGGRGFTSTSSFATTSPGRAAGARMSTGAGADEDKKDASRPADSPTWHKARMIPRNARDRPSMSTTPTGPTANGQPDDGAAHPAERRRRWGPALTAAAQHTISMIPARLGVRFHLSWRVSESSGSEGGSARACAGLGSPSRRGNLPGSRVDCEGVGSYRGSARVADKGPRTPALASR